MEMTLYDTPPRFQCIWRHKLRTTRGYVHTIPEYTSPSPIEEGKLHRAYLVLAWETGVGIPRAVGIIIFYQLGSCDMLYSHCKYTFFTVIPPSVPNRAWRVIIYKYKHLVGLYKINII